MPSRGSARTPLIALTATLRAGSPKDCISSLLGLRECKYHFIRRSNRRNDIQLIFRNMRSGMKNTAFPELDWVLTDGQKIIIFCAIGFRVVDNPVSVFSRCNIDASRVLIHAQIAEI